MPRRGATVRVDRYQERGAWVSETPELRIAVMQVGGHRAEIVLKEDQDINPLWQQARPTIDPTEFVPEVHEVSMAAGPPPGS